VRFLRAEKVLVTSLKKLDLPMSIRKLGKPMDKVPFDAMVFIGQ
jgi:hypothetical protein